MRRICHIKTGALVLGLLFFWLLFFWFDPEVTLPDAGGQKPSAFARSLHGTEPDGVLHFSGNSSPVGKVTSAELPNEALKRMFDYYLTTLGEVDEAVVLSKIGQEIDKNMPMAYARAARELLGKYVAYKKASENFGQNFGRDGQTNEGSIDMLRKRFEGLQRLRAEFFDPREYSDMFGFEDTYGQLVLSQRQIVQNTQLTEAERSERLIALHASLPTAIKDQLDAPHKVWQLQNQVEQLREKGASDDDIYRLRAQALNPEAAARLAELDREEVAWKSLISQYQASRQRILQSGDSPAQQQEALQQLQHKLFAPQEIPRLIAYDSPLKD